MKTIIILIFSLTSIIYSYDKGYKLIRIDGSVMYSQDGVNWQPFKQKTLKYATKYSEFSFDFDETIKPQKIDIYDLSGVKQNLDVSITNTELRINLPQNKIYYTTLYIDDIIYNIIILKY